MSVVALLLLLATSVVNCDDGQTLSFIQKPSSVHAIDCNSQNCKATLQQIVEVAAAAALVKPSGLRVPWLGPFGFTADTKPCGVIVVQNNVDDASQLPKDPSAPSFEIPLEGDVSSAPLTDNSIHLAEVDGGEQGVQLDIQDTLSSLNWNNCPKDNVLVLALNIKQDSHRMRRSATDDPNDTGDVSGPPLNIYNFDKEGSAASFQFAFWFAVVFAITVFVICVVLMQIDEGDDSIIYKTTSAKMGKRD